MKINSITIKKNKVICIIDSKEYIISNDTYTKYYLYPNKEITSDEFNDILSDSKLLKAKNYINLLLSHSRYSYNEIKRKLSKYKLSTKDINSILDPYMKEGIIDDYQYSLDYIQSKNNQCYGEKYLKTKLIQKGISEDILNKKDIIDALTYNNQFLEDFALKLSKANSSLPISKQKQKLSDYLIRRGFDYLLVSETIEKTNFSTDSKYKINLRKKIDQIASKLNKKDISKYQKKEQLIQKLISQGYKYDEFSSLINDIFD